MYNPLSRATFRQSRHDYSLMKSLLRLTALLLALLGVSACAQIQPAGSLGYLVDGNPRFRPLPKDYRHVPPRVEPVAPQFKVTF